MAKYNGKPVVTFSITRARGASDVTVYDGAVIVLNKLEKEYPGSIFAGSLPLWIIPRSSTKLDGIDGRRRDSGGDRGVLLPARLARDRSISAIAIPLSAIPTFWFDEICWASRSTRCRCVALGLVAGVLVDDAIVEIENIVRHMRMGKTAYQAAIDAADEIGLAVAATTFSIVAVFLPVGLMPGVSGEFFKNFGLTIVASVLMSLAVARMITPMVAAYFLKAHGAWRNTPAGKCDGSLPRRCCTGRSIQLARPKRYRQAPSRCADGHAWRWRHRLAARLRDHRVWHDRAYRPSAHWRSPC